MSRSQAFVWGQIERRLEQPAMTGMAVAERPGLAYYPQRGNDEERLSVNNALRVIGLLSLAYWSAIYFAVHLWWMA